MTDTNLARLLHSKMAAQRRWRIPEYGQSQIHDPEDEDDDELS